MYVSVAPPYGRASMPSLAPFDNSPYIVTITTINGGLQYASLKTGGVRGSVLKSKSSRDVSCHGIASKLCNTKKRLILGYFYK